MPDFETLRGLPEHTLILPAYGPPSTIRLELETNVHISRSTLTS